MANLLKFAQPQQYAPLQIGVAAPQNLQVGNRVITPGPGRSGVAPPVQRGNLNSLAQGFIGGAENAAANTVRATTDLRFLTPNFVPGVSKYVDPFIHSASNALASPFQAGANAANQVAPTKLGHIGNVAGQAGIYAPQAISAARGAVQLAKQVPHAIEAGGKVIANVNDARTPLNQIGAVGKNVNEPITPKVAKNLGQQLVNPAKVELTAKTPTGKKNLGLVNTIQESKQTSAPLQQITQGKYNPIGNKAAMSAASQRIAHDSQAAYNFAATTHSAEGNATAIQIAKQLEAAGKPDQAANLMVAKAQQALQAGQGNQIYSLWDKLSPETVAQTAAKTIEKYNQTAKSPVPQLTAEQYQNFVNQAKNIQSLPEGSRAKGMATQNLLKQIGHLVPSSKTDKAFALYRTGLLTGFRTPGKVLVSHAVSSGFEQAKNVPAAVADKGISLFTGKRGMSLTFRGNLSGAKTGTMGAIDNLVHGYKDPLTGGSQPDFTNDVHFGKSLAGKAANAYVQGVTRLHSSIYQPFFGSQHFNSLYDMAITNAKNEGLHGTDRSNAVTNFISDAIKAAKQDHTANPHADFTTPEGAAQRANAEAQYTTFQNKTILSKAAQGLKQSTPGARYIVPFSQIPSSIASKIVDYAPTGLVKEAISQAKNGSFDQRALSQAIGRSSTGTGIAALGYHLFNSGHITTAYPTDKKTQAQWKLEGKQANAVLVGGKWRQLASLGPAGDVLAVGANVAEGLKGNKKTPGSITNAAIQGGIGGINVLGNSPYLQGIQNVGAAISQPGTKSQKVAEGLAGGVIPTAIANIASATDPLQRQTNSPVDSVTNKIPGIREKNLPQVDVLGRNIPRAQGPLGTLLDPFYSTTAKTNPLTSELNRLNNTYNPATPTPLLKNQSINNQKVNLNPKQLTQLQQVSGTALNSQLNNLIRSPGYQSLGDQAKAKAINNLTTSVRDQVKGNIALSGGKITGSGNNIAGLNKVVQSGQQAADKAAFIKSGQDIAHINGMVYQKDSNGKVSVMEQRSYDYKQANDGLTSAKSSGDVTGYLNHGQSLLGNISWQLNHATLTQSERDALVNKAVSVQNDLSKTNAYGGFDKPKNVATYKAPEIIGAKDGYVSQIQAAGAKYGLDINALLAVAAQEGLGGGVGDNGTSFGPFHIHAGGALPPGKSQAWAESPAGIDYAVQQIAKVAGGKHGADAIQAIVTGFEKSANQPGEIQNALALYGGGKATLSPGVSGGNATYASVTGSSSSSSSAKPKVPNFKTSLSSLKAPKVGKISARGSKAPKFNTPKVASLKTSTPKVRSSRQKSVAKLPVSAIPKIPKKQLA